MSERQVQYTDGSWSREVEVTDLLDEATRLLDEATRLAANSPGRPRTVTLLRALVERVQQAEEALRDVPCEHQRAGYLRMQAERDEWHKAALTATAGESRAERERDEARGKLDQVRTKASEWMRNEERSADYQDGRADSAEDVLAILDGETGD